MKKLPCSWIDRINTKIAILLKAIYRVNVIPIKILLSFFKENGQSILKFIWKYKRAHKAEAILSKKSNAGSITIPASDSTTEPY
jgi:hypothetical protein